MADSIRIPEQYNDMFKDMCTDRKNQKVFDSYKDLLLFAATLGKSKNVKVKIDKSTLDPVRLTIFRGDYDLDIINCIALAETGEPKIMSELESDTKLRIIEDYCNGGLKIIYEKVYTQPGNWETAILDLMISEEKEESDPLDDITKAWEE